MPYEREGILIHEDPGKNRKDYDWMKKVAFLSAAGVPVFLILAGMSDDPNWDVAMYVGTVASGVGFVSATYNAIKHKRAVKAVSGEFRDEGTARYIQGDALMRSGERLLHKSKQFDDSVR